MSDKQQLLSLDEAFKIVEEQLTGIKLPTETIPVRLAFGRVIVQDQLSRLDLPPFDKSAMDGFAVLADDQRDEYRILETVPAGGVPTIPLKPGTATKVMTGAPVPDGAGKVIMIEKTTESEGKIHVHTPEHKSNICYEAEDVRKGDIVLGARTTIGSLQIANLISAGITEVKVVRPLCVSILATGDEIVESVEHLTPGKIMNSNGPMLEALCRDYGLEVVENSIVHDDLNETITALRQALDRSDMVIFSGGVSVGDFDYVTEAIRDIDLELHFSRVAVKPGKPVNFATAGQKVIYGMPGNPVSVFLMFHLFVLRAARLMLGQCAEIRHIKMPITNDYCRKKAKRLAYIPCRVTRDGFIEQIEYHGSAHLQALLKSDGFFIVPEGVEKIAEGEKVTFMPIKGTL